MVTHNLIANKKFFVYIKDSDPTSLSQLTTPTLHLQDAYRAEKEIRTHLRNRED